MVKNPLTAPTKDGYLCCWTVGVQLLGCICLCAGHTGAALNPAVGAAIVVFDCWELKTDFYYQYMWIYTCGPYIGGMIAGLFHHYHVWSTVTVLRPQVEIKEEVKVYQDLKALDE